MKKFLWEIYRKINKLPEFVCIEACSLCNLKCRDCYMREHVYGDNPPAIGKGYLKFEDYKNFIDKNPYIKSVELSFAGEIFLNPDLLKIIKYSWEKHIKLTALNGVNFNFVSDEMLEALVKYKFTALTVSIDGGGNNTYSKYRIGGNFDKVMENIKKLNELKQKYNSKFPILKWQYIVFEHNKHEINTAASIAKSLDFSSIYYKNPWNHEVNIREHVINLSNDEEINEILNQNSIIFCMQVYFAPQINWDGRLLGCFTSKYGDLGVNVFKMSLKKALNSKKTKYVKSVVTGKKQPDNSIACSYCEHYREMKKQQCFIKFK